MTEAVSAVKTQPVVKPEVKPAEKPKAPAATTAPVEPKKPETTGTVSGSPAPKTPAEGLGKKLHIIA